MRASTRDSDLLRHYTRVLRFGKEHVLEVGEISWSDSHTPVLSWREVKRLPAKTPAAEIKRAQRQLLQRRRFFVVCEECGERQATGHTNGRVCYGCLERNHGMVF